MTSAKTRVHDVETAVPGVIAALLLTHVLSPPVFAQSVPVLRGDAGCAWGSADCNRCVPDVVGATERLRSHGDILGFHMNGAADVDPPGAH
jgi:hypothetical protein